ncbi:MAG TPA: flagellar filament capping protein FliD [Croceibacterium sp.]
MSAIGSLVTSLGAGSGVDMSKLASDLAEAQFALRSDRLTAQTEQLGKQISTASSIKNALSLLTSSLGERVRTGDLSTQATVANATVASASSPAGTVGSGSYSLEVTALAKAQTLASTPFGASTDTVGAGKLIIRFGETTAGSFAADGARAPLTIDIAAGKTLADVASAINAKGAGIKAYVAQTADGAQLVLKGAEGAKNGFIVEAVETPGQEGLAALAWDPANGGAPARLTSTSGNAAFKLDGLPMTSAGNDTGTIAPGLALKLTGTNTGAPTQIAFASPTSTIAGAMGDLVSALNEVAGALRDATDPMGGDLARDPGARTLQRQFAKLATTVVMPNAATDAPRTLSDLGLSIQRDGTFRLDSAVLQRTLARDPAGAAAMFTAGLYGVYATFDKMTRAATSTGDPGSLGGSILRYQTRSADISEVSAKLAEQQETLRANLVSRFARADTRIGSSKSTLSFLQSQIDAWNASKD